MEAILGHETVELQVLGRQVMMEGLIYDLSLFSALHRPSHLY